MYFRIESIGQSRGLIFTLGTATLLYLFRRFYNKSKPVRYNRQAAAFITGCDTGLGYSIAIHCKDSLNLNVIASCVSKKSAGAQSLESHGITVVELDLDNVESIISCHKYIEEHVLNNDLELKLLINNAAVMTFGEFDWKPMDSIVKELNVNLIGPMMLTKLLMNLILTHKTRIVNICSHCSLETLPGLLPYATSKAAMLAWTNGLRAELDKYDVKVVAVIPGSFYTQTSIMSDPQYYLSAMKESMSHRPEAVQALYGDYFHSYLDYVSLISKYSLRIETPRYIEDSQIMRNIHNALLDSDPRAVYQCNNVLRYAFYHTIFRFLPHSYFKDRLIEYFMQMPKYKKIHGSHVQEI